MKNIRLGGNVGSLKSAPSSHYTLQLSSSSNYDNLNGWANPESGGADIREVNHAIAGIAVQFRGGNLLWFKAFQQRIKHRMRQAERAINRLFNSELSRMPVSIQRVMTPR